MGMGSLTWSLTPSWLMLVLLRVRLVISCLSGCFRKPLAVGVSQWWLAQVGCTPYLLVFAGFTPSSKPEQCLERRHRRFAPIVTKYEFIQVNLELIATNAVMGPQQPLLEIADGSVRQRDYRLRPFA